MECAPASVGSTLSWNTFLSRTSVSTLACAIFSERQGQSVHGLEDVIRAVGSLQLRRYRYEELVREETLGEGETYLVEKAVQGGAVFAVKHLKISSTPDEKAFRRRLSAVTVEAQIMRHSPLRAHPNLPSVIGYGWNIRGKLIIPFLVVEYAPFGTLREYIQKFAPTISDAEILLGDVASALAALHVCGIVHGDVKLDNVLVFPSWNRPAKALAKLTDFGHALILNDKSKKHDDEIVKYGGTTIYNAPEVRTQDLFPIDRKEARKCDIWAFGILVWEACIGGEEYIKYLARNGVVANTSGNDHRISGVEMLRHAKGCLPTGQLGAAMFLRIVLHKAIQEDPLKRAASIRDLPLFTRWNTGNLLGLEADLALHFEAPTPTYEMFRLDTGKEILWHHQQRIFQGLKHTHTNNLARERGPISWQIALCHHVGFGTVQDARSAHEYSQMAKSEFHPIAMAFGHLLDPHMNESSESPEGTYAANVCSLLRSNPSYSKAMPNLVKAFFYGNLPAVFDLLSKRVSLSSSSVDGCSLFHWLFMFQDTTLEEIIERLSGNLSQRLVNLPMCSTGPVHDQWPLELLGSPLAVAISVNSLPAVKALLSLGADPFSFVYGRAQFPPDDLQSQWTAFHIAAKYHCSEILAHLLEQTKSRQQTSINSLACVLSSSTALERFAMHGSSYAKQLDETVRLIRGIQPLGAMDTAGRTGLMMAIDVQDHHVITTLLRTDKELAKTPFYSPKSPDIFTYPIHFSAQIAARRDGPETLTIPKTLNSYTDTLSSGLFSRDSMGKTPLHLAVTGSLSLVASWILEEDIGLMHVEDLLGRTPLHYCASSPNFNLLLGKGADLNHVDKRRMTALHGVCYLGASDLVACLLKWKPKLDLKDDIYGTPLHCGVISGSIDVVMALVEDGAPINAADANGNTAAHVAAKLNRHNILRVLIQKGADISLPNINGRDPKAIALHAARDFGILRILQHGRRENDERQSILEITDEEEMASRVEDQPTYNPYPDFLWDEDSMPVVEADGLTNLRQSADGDPYIYGDQQETYDQRMEKLEKLDKFAGVVTRNFSSLYPNRKAATAVVKRLAVFFDAITWQPGIASRIIEIIARAARDLAYIVHFYVKKADLVQQRVEAWAEFLTTHDGIILRDFERLESLWSHMEESDPVPTSHQTSNTPEYLPNTKELGDPSFQERIPLQLLLFYMKARFSFKSMQSLPSLPEQIERRNVQKVFELRETKAVEDWEMNRRLEAEGGRGEQSPEEPGREEWTKATQSEELKLYCRFGQEVMSHCDHINLAIDWITAIVMDRKPETIFPGRCKSDIESMARWEVETWTMQVTNDEITYYSATLFDFFPQLSEPSWRESSSREYLKWQQKTAFGFLRDEYHAQWAARNEFFKSLYESCVGRREEGQPGEGIKM